jgi:hypothetical protein
VKGKNNPFCRKNRNSGSNVRADTAIYTTIMQIAGLFCHRTNDKKRIKSGLMPSATLLLQAESNRD